MRTVLLRAATATLAVALVAVPATTLAARGHPARTPRPVPAADWTTYHHDVLRTGDGVIHGTYSALTPKVAWMLPKATPLERTDQIYAPPLVVGTTAFVTTLENRVYAISLTTKHTLWSRTLGAPYTPPPNGNGNCGDVHPNVGIVSTPVVDEGRGELFAVADVGTGTGGTTPVHRLFGLSTSTGKVLLSRIVDPAGQSVVHLLQRASLAIAKGRVIFGFGGNAGDCGTYHGWVISVPEFGSGAIDRFEVARALGKGAVWMGGAAPVVYGGNVYVSDGNSLATSSSDAYDYSDAVLKLSPTMQLLDWFAPTTWYTDNLHDYDLGSSAPQFLPNGKMLAIGKTQTVYVLNPSNLGHVTGSVPTFPLCTEGKAPGTDAQGGDAIVGTLVVVGCMGGLDAATFSSSPPYGTKAWTQPLTGGPPVYGGGLIWSVSAPKGVLYGLNPATGAVQLQYTIGPVQNHFPTPAIGDNMVLVTTETALLGFPPG